MKNNDDYNSNSVGEYSLCLEKLDSVDFLLYAPQEEELSAPGRKSGMAVRTIAWLQRNAGDEFIALYGRRILGVTNWFCAAVKKSRRITLSHDDVFQTACVQSLRIKEECREERWLPFQMKHILQNYMWRELADMLPTGCGFDPADLLARIPDRRVKRWLQMLEMDDLLERALSGRELAVAKLLLADWTRVAIAREFDVSPSMVTRWIASIREKLRPLFGESDPDAPDDRDLLFHTPQSPHQTPDSLDEQGVF